MLLYWILLGGEELFSLQCVQVQVSLFSYGEHIHNCMWSINAEMSL